MDKIESNEKNINEYSNINNKLYIKIINKSICLNLLFTKNTKKKIL
jgi:hypothetical protein